MKFAVIGSGPMGLMAAIEILDAGHEVDVYERDDRVGGMSASFDFDGTRIERYYHFICKTDYPLFDLLKRFDLYDRLRWTDTQMGYFYQGKLYPWGTPTALLTFPHLNVIEKVRYALHVLHTKSIRDWTALDKENATRWITKWIGANAYDVLWKNAFHLKFFEHADNLSASWIGTRIKRIALSRRSLFHESLGYLQGGSETLLDALESDIRGRGGRILLRAGVDKVVCEGPTATGIITSGQYQQYDNVLSTAPIQYVPGMVPDLPSDFSAAIRRIENIPVACVILKSKHPITDKFWTNISDSHIEIPGLIEYSNLNPETGDGNSIVYAPFYMPKTHPKWSQSNDSLIREVVQYLPRINPTFRDDWILAAHCHRYEFAQTICPPNFQQALPPMRTPIKGFFMADTAYYYPEDRSISESIAVGTALAREALLR